MYFTNFVFIITYCFISSFSLDGFSFVNGIGKKILVIEIPYK